MKMGLEALSPVPLRVGRGGEISTDWRKEQPFFHLLFAFLPLIIEFN